VSIIERIIKAIEAIAAAQTRQAVACESMAESQATTVKNARRIAEAQETHNVLDAQWMEERRHEGLARGK
jgi:Ni/Co efflux regulator RcnB